MPATTSDTFTLSSQTPTTSYPRQLSPYDLTVLGVTLLALALRLHHLTYQSFWRDEMDAVFFANRGLADLARMFLRVGENGPAYFVFLHGWLAVFGTSDFAVRFSSVVAGVAAVPLLYRLGSSIFDRRVGVMAATLLALSPYHVWYAQEAKMYALVAFVSALSVWLLRHALYTNRWRSWFYWLALLGVGFYLHFFVALLIASQVLFIVYLWRRGQLPGARKGMTLVVALGVIYLPLAAWQIPLLLSGLHTSYQFLLPDSVIAVLLTKFSLGMAQPSSLQLLLFAFLFLSGAILPIRSVPTSARLLITGWVILPIVFFLVVSLRIPLFLDRYLMIVFPGFILLLGAGLIAIAERSAITAAVALLLVIGIWLPGSWNTPLVKQDFKRAVAYLDPRIGPRDTLLFLPSWERAYFDYYHPVAYRWADLLPVDQDGLLVVTQQAEQILSDPNATLWLVSVEPSYGDRDRQFQSWLDTHAVLLGDVPLANLDLRHYRGPITADDAILSSNKR